jgi:hypothetical protein
MAGETLIQKQRRMHSVLARHGCVNLHVIVWQDMVSGAHAVRFRDKMTTRMTELSPEAAEHVLAEVGEKCKTPGTTITTAQLLDLVDTLPNARKLNHAPKPRLLK